MRKLLIVDERKRLKQEIINTDKLLNQEFHNPPKFLWEDRRKAFAALAYLETLQQAGKVEIDSDALDIFE